MKAGCIRVDITPPVGVPIGGNVRSDNLSRGIHDSLYANVLYLEHNNACILIVNLDLIGLHRPCVLKLKERIFLKTGLTSEHMIVTATHTHSGPDLMEALKDEYHPSIIPYLEDLYDKVSNGAMEALNNTFSAHLFVGRALEDRVSFNRRLFFDDGRIVMNWEQFDPNRVTKAAGPIDPELIVWKVTDEEQRVRSVLVNFTLHPAVLVGKDWMFSRDFIHDLNEYLLEQIPIDCKTPVLFINGALGNVNHVDIILENQERGFEETRRIGRQLGEKAILALNQSVLEENPDIRVQLKTVSLNRRAITAQEVERAREVFEKCGGKIPSILDGVPDEAYAREILILQQQNKESVETELQVFQVGSILGVCLPGEFFVEFGLELKRRLHFSKTMIFGLANDYVGYVPTMEAFEQGGYEVRTSRHSQLVPDAGPQIIQILSDMVEDLL